MGIGRPPLNGSPGRQPAVFLDRDGTLNRCFPSADGTTTVPPASIDDLVLADGALKACARLRQAGYLLLVVTNQPDVRRGTQSRDAVEAINRHLVAELGLDGVAACYHDDRDGCACRKPKPGLLHELAARHHIDLSRSWMVGDRLNDIRAGVAAGCRTVLVCASPTTPGTRPGLSAAADRILNNQTSPGGAPMHRNLSDLSIKIFADGADLAQMKAFTGDPLIKGFTTNPTLMKKAGVTRYRDFAAGVLAVIPDLPVSFEVLSDDVDQMTDEARVIGSWGDNVYVKVPITNTQGESTLRIVEQLNRDGVKLNVTAITTLAQSFGAAASLTHGTPAIISVFAGRIADTGRDPVPMMAAVADVLHATPGVELLWASPRELLNVFHAEDAGCQIITVTGDLLAKRHLVGKDLDEYSLETVQMFANDAAGMDMVLDFATTG